MIIEDYLQEELAAWAAVFVKDRVAYLRSRKISASKDLERSLQYEIRNDTFRGAVTLMLAFEEYGRFIDMKRLKPAKGGGDYIEGLIQWIKERGLEEQFVRRYMRRRRLKKVPARVLNQIAWGIAIKRSSRSRTRRRAWYNKPKSAAIRELFNQVAANMPEQVADEIKKTFS